MKITGLDLAKPGNDKTVVTIHGGRRCGKMELMRKIVEKALDDGMTVYDSTTGEIRGAGAAKDVTPRAPKLLK